MSKGTVIYDLCNQFEKYSAEESSSFWTKERQMKCKMKYIYIKKDISVQRLKLNYKYAALFCSLKQVHPEAEKTNKQTPKTAKLNCS